jgi:hypothetical protein
VSVAVAVVAAQSIRSRELGIYATRIIDFSVSDSRPVVGKDVMIQGTLQTHTPIFCWWEGLGGEPVAILVDDREVGSALSGGDGVFHFVWRPTAVGSFLVRARYPGSWKYDPCESTPIRVEVITEEEKKEEELRFWLMVAGVGVAAVGVIGGVLWYMGESERRRMMMAALAR